MIPELTGLAQELHAAVGICPGVLIRLESPSGVVDAAVGCRSRHDSTPLSSESPFQIASISKTFTAATCLRLADMGLLDLDAPVRQHLPAEVWRALAAAGFERGISVRHLLAHRAGLADIGEDPALVHEMLADRARVWSPAELVVRAAGGGPLAPPGESYHYSDTGYTLAALVVEAVAGRPFCTAVRDLLDFAGLGLFTTYLAGRETGPEPAHAYYGELDLEDLDPSTDNFGAGGHVSTCAELAVFLRALLTGQVLSDEGLSQLLTGVPVAGRGLACLGIQRTNHAGIEAWGHFGFHGAFMFHAPELEATVTGSVLANSPAWGAEHPMRRAVAEALAMLKRPGGAA